MLLKRPSARSEIQWPDGDEERLRRWSEEAVARLQCSHGPRTTVEHFVAGFREDGGGEGKDPPESLLPQEVLPLA